MGCRLSVVCFLIGICLPIAVSGQASSYQVDAEKQAASAMEDGRYGDAARLYERLAEKSPRTGAYWFRAGLARYQNGDYTGAVQAFSHALTLDPSDVHTQAFLGLSEAALRHKDTAAIAYLSAAFNARGIEPELRRLTGIQLAAAFARCGRPLDAQNTYTALQREFPDDVEIAYQSVMLHLAEGRRLISKLVNAAPDSWRTHELLGFLLLDRESYDAAAEQFRIALHANPHAPGINRALGDIALAKSRDDPNSRALARDLYQKELEIDPLDSATFRRLADIAILGGKTQEAQNFLDRAIAAEPDSAANFLSMCKHFSQQNRDDDALKWCGKAVNANSADAQAHYRLAQLFRKLGREQDARDEMEKFRVLDARKRTESLYMTGAQIGMSDAN